MKQAGRNAGATGWLVKTFQTQADRGHQEGHPLIDTRPRSEPHGTRRRQGEMNETGANAGRHRPEPVLPGLLRGLARTSNAWNSCCSVDMTAADDEELNAIFRCAHSIKGGAAAFGFMDVAELTHQMETLLDKLRRHEADADHRDGRRAAGLGRRLRACWRATRVRAATQVDTTELLFSIRALAAGEAVPAGAGRRRRAATAARTAAGRAGALGRRQRRARARAARRPGG